MGPSGQLHPGGRPAQPLMPQTGPWIAGCHKAQFTRNSANEFMFGPPRHFGFLHPLHHPRWILECN